MSTLGSKAMKKTLERLKKEAMEDMNKYSEVRNKNKSIANIVYCANLALISAITYIQALEEYCHELDEEWNKLLESARQAKPVKKKEGSKEKPFYT